MGLIPLITFLINLIFGNIIPHQFIISCLLTALALSMVGAIKGKVTGKHWIISSLQTLLIGGIAATLAFLVGHFTSGLVP
jgi:VIT1/CCC1 family predicted Fe2+/Mn2+ transporter